MKNGIRIKATAIFLLFIYIFFNFSGIISSAENVVLPASAAADAESAALISDSIKVSSRIFELFARSREDEMSLAVGGTLFGIKIKEEGVSVSESTEGSPLKARDRIISVNGREVGSPEEIEAAVNAAGGVPIEIVLIRDGKSLKLHMTPKLDAGKYKLGVTLRSLATGIGTVSFIDPETKLFAGLGHGVCETTGELISLKSGVSTDVILSGVKRGEAGKPGELTGALTRKTTGTLFKNTDCGIFGQFDSIDEDELEILPVAKRGEIKSGAAEIISSVKNGRSARYKIEIFDIDYSSNGPKSFKIKVTDEVLKSLTGGIVRGMSGSPVIQNGKIVGALTHVMVNDSEMGYGIFIENMLASIPKALPDAA